MKLVSRNKEENPIPNDFRINDLVIYIPITADGNQNHSMCGKGVVTQTNEHLVFVQLFDKLTGKRKPAQAFHPKMLKKI